MILVLLVWEDHQQAQVRKCAPQTYTVRTPTAFFCFAPSRPSSKSDFAIQYAANAPTPISARFPPRSFLPPSFFVGQTFSDIDALITAYLQRGDGGDGGDGGGVSANATTAAVDERRRAYAQHKRQQLLALLDSGWW